MTWHQAYRIADEQVAWWRFNGISAPDAEHALRLDMHVEPTWNNIRRQLAEWAMKHADKWGE